MEYVNNGFLRITGEGAGQYRSYNLQQVVNLAMLVQDDKSPMLLCSPG